MCHMYKASIRLLTSAATCHYSQPCTFKVRKDLWKALTLLLSNSGCEWGKAEVSEQDGDCLVLNLVHHYMFLHPPWAFILLAEASHLKNHSVIFMSV